MKSHRPDFSKLLSYYQKEMAYLCDAGQLFGQAYPGVARALDLSARGSWDPHVQRLLESFAFLTSRLQMSLDDQAPELSSGLLDAIYPQLNAPVPSCVMVEASLSPAVQGEGGGVKIPRGSMMRISSQEGKTCRFRTCMDEVVWPLKVSDVRYVTANDYVMHHSHLLKSPWLVKVELQTTHGRPLGTLGLDQLRFYLGGDILTAMTLFRWIHGWNAETTPCVFIQTDLGGPLVPISGLRVEKTGFAPDHTLIPGAFEVAPAYCLLLEFFTLVQKFLYIHLGALGESFSKVKTSSCSLYFPLCADGVPSKWPLGKDNMMVGVIPAVNLFEKILEPVRVTQEKQDYRLVTEHGREDEFEIHSILKVAGSFDVNTAPETYAPYFAYGLQARHKRHKNFWLKRRARTLKVGLGGSDVFLSFVDSKLDISQPPDKTVYVQALCTNRSLAHSVPAYAPFDLEDAFLVGVKMRSLDRPTRALMPPIDGQGQWRLIRHLTIDHLSLCAKAGKAEPLRELLRLYNLGQNSLGAAVEAIQEVSWEESVGRVGRDAWRGFVPLMSVSVRVDDVRANTQGAFVLVGILHEIFKRSGGFNTLVETKMVGHTSRQVIKRWHPEPCTAPLL